MKKKIHGKYIVATIITLFSLISAVSITTLICLDIATDFRLYITMVLSWILILFSPYIYSLRIEIKKDTVVIFVYLVYFQYNRKKYCNLKPIKIKKSEIANVKILNGTPSKKGLFVQFDLKNGEWFYFALKGFDNIKKLKQDINLLKNEIENINQKTTL